ncbi:MAG: hypothetical protein HKN43_08615 [Rhodothermales bacterium]|nr:hypothetical protein [Rhodothermales bacterium]
MIVEHHSGHPFVLTISFEPIEEGTLVGWRQVFDTSSHYNQIADLVAQANEQNLIRLENEVGAAPRV